MSSPPQVTLVAHHVGPIGGMELALWELILDLLARGHEVTVIARRCELPSHPRLRWIRVPTPARPFLILYPSFLLVGSLLTRFRRKGVLHTTGALILNRADVSTVQFCHHGQQARTSLPRTSSSRLRRLNSRLAAWLSRSVERWAYRPTRTRHLVPVSNGVAAELLEHFPSMASAISVIPNGVDREVYRPDPDTRERTRNELGFGPQDHVAIFVGSEWERKGLHVAIDSMGRASSWQLLVVGRGDTQRYEEMADRVAPGRVRFVGEQENTLPYYLAADAFVFPTAYEAFSLSLLEAAACGLPLLVTRVNGTEELVVEGQNGWLVERDSASIGERLGQLAADEDLRRRMGASARDATRHFTWKRVVDSYVDLYAELDAAG